MSCDECRRLLNADALSPKLAREVEAAAPDCMCEAESMSALSPGPVENHEILHRIMVSPRDYDPVTKLIAQRPFEKLFANGLSVMRDRGSDADFLDIAEDSLLSKPGSDFRSVQAVCSVGAGAIREIESENQQQAFCIYDQTVPRNIEGADPVPTHAGILQRDIKFDVDGAKKHNKDLAFLVYEKFLATVQPASSFREDLFSGLNEKAALGGYAS